MTINIHGAASSKLAWAGTASRVIAVTPSDTVDITITTTALYIGTAGDVKFTTSGGDTVTIPAVPVGLLQVQATRVFATGTTASNIFAFGI